MDKIKEVIAWLIFSTLATVVFIFVAALCYKSLDYIGIPDFLIYTSVICIIICYAAILIASFIEMVGIDQ